MLIARLSAFIYAHFRAESPSINSENVDVGEFTIQVWQKAAEIYAALSKQGKPVGGKYDGDVFIAAYCIVNG